MNSDNKNNLPTANEEVEKDLLDRLKFRDKEAHDRTFEENLDMLALEVDDLTTFAPVNDDTDTGQLPDEDLSDSEEVNLDLDSVDIISTSDDLNSDTEEVSLDSVTVDYGSDELSSDSDEINLDPASVVPNSDDLISDTEEVSLDSVTVDYGSDELSSESDEINLDPASVVPNSDDLISDTEEVSLDSVTVDYGSDELSSESDEINLDPASVVPNSDDLISDTEEVSLDSVTVDYGSDELSSDSDEINLDPATVVPNSDDLISDTEEVSLDSVTVDYGSDELSSDSDEINLDPATVVPNSDDLISDTEEVSLDSVTVDYGSDEISSESDEINLDPATVVPNSDDLISDTEEVSLESITVAYGSDDSDSDSDSDEINLDPASVVPNSDDLISDTEEVSLDSVTVDYGSDELSSEPDEINLDPATVAPNSDEIKPQEAASGAYEIGVNNTDDNIEETDESFYIIEDDFVLTDIEGFGDTTPAEFLKYVEEGGDITELVPAKDATLEKLGFEPGAFDDELANSDENYTIPYDPQRQFEEKLDEIILEDDEYSIPFAFEADYLDNNDDSTDAVEHSDEILDQDNATAAEELVDYADLNLDDDLPDEDSSDISGTGETLSDSDDKLEAEPDSDKNEDFQLDKNDNIGYLEDVTDKIILDLPEGIKEQMPEDFKIEPVDLKEAEKIANEDILLLTEEDLIEELNSEDLKPVPEDEEADELDSDDLAISVGQREIQYILPHEDSLSVEEKQSIEEDIESSAIVIEEDFEDIKSKYDLIYSEYEKEQNSKKSAVDTLDITDRVVILDNDRDLDLFIDNSIEESKQGDLKKMLSYLDGLFEKLPEDIIKNFAKSEYFDLYTKIMKDLGV